MEDHAHVMRWQRLRSPFQQQQKVTVMAYFRAKSLAMRLVELKEESRLEIKPQPSHATSEISDLIGIKLEIDSEPLRF